MTQSKENLLNQINQVLEYNAAILMKTRGNNRMIPPAIHTLLKDIEEYLTQEETKVVEQITDSESN